VTAQAPTRPTLAYAELALAAPAADKGPLVFTASSTRLNRYGFALRHSGWRIGNYQRNPVVLWMHDPTTPPIGRARAELDSLREELRAAVTFDPGDELAATVERKVRGGFLNAVSVGWEFTNADGSPIKDWYRLSAEQVEREAYYDLSEISVVSVPGDPSAVRAAQSLAAAGGDVVAAQVVRRLVVEVLAERAANRPGDALACFPPPTCLAPILGSRP
jgi:HK97 family phage prohead protease